jgi:hypothetical protein
LREGVALREAVSGSGHLFVVEGRPVLRDGEVAGRTEGLVEVVLELVAVRVDLGSGRIRGRVRAAVIRAELAGFDSHIVLENISFISFGQKLRMTFIKGIVF